MGDPGQGPVDVHLDLRKRGLFVVLLLGIGILSLEPLVNGTYAGSPADTIFFEGLLLVMVLLLLPGFLRGAPTISLDEAGIRWKRHFGTADVFVAWEDIETTAFHVPFLFKAGVEIRARVPDDERSRTPRSFVVMTMMTTITARRLKTLIDGRRPARPEHLASPAPTAAGPLQDRGENATGKPEHPPSGPVTVTPDPFLTAFAVAVLTGLFCVFVYMAFDPDVTADIVGVASGITLGLTLLAVGQTLLRGLPATTIDENGITVRQRNRITRAVRWGEVRGVSLLRRIGPFFVVGSPLIGVDLVDDDKYIRQMPLALRALWTADRLIGLSRAFRHPAMSFPARAESMTPDELKACIERYLAAARTRSAP